MNTTVLSSILPRRRHCAFPRSSKNSPTTVLPGTGPTLWSKDGRLRNTPALNRNPNLPSCVLLFSPRYTFDTKPESTDGRREGWANWDEGAYKEESLVSIGTDVTRQRVFSSRTGPRERSMEAGNRVIVRSDAAGCTRGPGGREFGGVGLDADSAVRLGVGWLAVGPGREWPAQPRASPWEDAK